MLEAASKLLIAVQQSEFSQFSHHQLTYNSLDIQFSARADILDVSAFQ